MTFNPEHTEVLIGFGLFFLSEAIGMSKYRSNSVLQLLLTAAMRAFPYELQRRKKPEPPKPNVLDIFKR